MKQPEWQREGISGALSSTSQQLNLEPSEQRERERENYEMGGTVLCKTVKENDQMIYNYTF